MRERERDREGRETDNRVKERVRERGVRIEYLQMEP